LGLILVGKEAAQFDRPRMMADRAPLLVGDGISGPAGRASGLFAQLHHTLLRRSEQHDALDVAVDEVVIIILLKDRGS
jgi:hypothetical protein